MTDTRPGLVWRLAYNYGSGWTADDSTTATRCPIRFLNAQDSRTGLQFLLRGADGTETPVDVEDLTFSDYLHVESAEGSFCFLSPTAPAEAAVSCSDECLSGAQYRLDVVTPFPEVGLYRAPAVSSANYMPVWQYTGPEQTVYLLRADGKAITGASVESYSEYSEDLQISCANGAAALQLPALKSPNTIPLNYTWMEGETAYGDETYLRMEDWCPGLVWSWASDSTSSVSHLPLQFESLGEGSYKSVRFWLRGTDGSLMPVDVADLALPSYLKTKQVDGASCQLYAAAPGEDAIRFGSSGLEASAAYPDVALYSAPQRSSETYLAEWNYTGPEQTVYLIRADGKAITGAWYDDDTQIGFQSENGAASMQIDEPAFFGSFSVRYEWTDGEDTNSSWAYFNLTDKRTGLVWCSAEQGYYYNEAGSRVYGWHATGAATASPISFSNPGGSSRRVQFLLRDADGTETPVNVSALSMPGCVTLGSVSGSFCSLSPAETGRDSIVLEQDGQRYPLGVSVGIPELGVYSAPEATIENYLKEWTYRGESATVYLIARYGYTVSDVSCTGAAADVTYRDDGAAAVTLTEPLDTTVTLSCKYNGYTKTVKLAVNDLRPGLVWRLAKNGSHLDEATQTYVNGIYAETDAKAQRVPIQSQLNSEIMLQLLLRDAQGDLTPVDVSQATFPTTQVEVMETEGSFVRMHAVKPGSGTLSCGEGSLPVEIAYPVTGFYSEPRRSPETYLEAWEYRGASDKVYLIRADDGVIGDLTLSGSDYTGLLSSQPLLDGTVRELTLSDLPDSSAAESLTFNYVNGSYVYCGIMIRDLRPGLVWQSMSRTYNNGAYVWVPYDTAKHYAISFSSMSAYNYSNVRFLLRGADGTETPLKPDDVQIPMLFTAETAAEDDSVCKLTPVRPGVMDITYSDGQNTYTLGGSVGFPDAGLFSAAEEKAETYLTELRIGNDPTTVYLIRHDGNRISDVTCNYFSQSSDYTVEYPSDSVAKLTFYTVPNGSTLYLNYYYYYNSYSRYASLEIPIRDARTSLTAQTGYYQWDETAQKDVWTSDYGSPYTQITFYSPDATGNYYLLQITNPATGTALPDAGCLSFPAGLLEPVTVNGDGVVFLKPAAPGEGSIVYDDGTVRCTIPVTVRYPTVAFYTTETKSAESYCSAWRYTDETASLYLIRGDGQTITEVSNGYYGSVLDSGDYTVEYLSNGAAKITVHTLEQSGKAVFQYAYGDYGYTDTAQIQITDAREGLVWFTAWNLYDETLQQSVWTPTGEAKGVLRLESVGYSEHVYFQLRGADGSYTPVDAARLTYPETVKPVTVEGGYCHLSAVAPGERSIIYTDGETRYELPVTVGFPYQGLYATDEETAEGYVSTWRYTDERKSVYLMRHDGSVISDVSCSSLSDGDYSVEYLKDGAVAKITVERFDDVKQLRFSYRYSASGYSGSITVPIMDARPGLAWIQVNSSWDSEQQQYTYSLYGDPRRRMDFSYGPNRTEYALFVLYGDDGSYAPLDASVLSFPDTLQAERLADNYFSVKSVRPGEGSISCSVGSQTWEMPASVSFPDAGFYTSDTERAEDYLPEWRYDGTNKTVYLLRHDGQAISDLTTTSLSSDMYSVEYLKNNTVVKITLSDLDRDRYVSFNYYYGEKPSRGYATIQMRDVQPGLFWCYAYRNANAGVWTAAGTPSRNMISLDGPDKTRSVQFKFRDANMEYTTVDVSSLSIPSFLTAENTEGSYCTLRSLTVGSGAITLGDYALAAEVTFPSDNRFSAAADGAAEFRIPDGGSATMKVAVSAYDASKISYAWYKYVEDATEGRVPQLIEGEAGGSLTVGAPGDYFCSIDDGYDHVLSVNFTVRVINHLSVACDGDRDRNVAPGGSLTMRVKVTADDMTGMTYRWLGPDGAVISGATGASLTVANAAVKDRGWYSCVATDRFGNEADAAFYLALNHLTVTRIGSYAVPAAPGGSATLSVAVSADDTAGLAIGWSGENGAAIPDATGTSLTLENVSGETVYTCAVTDAYGNRAEVSFRVYVENGLTVTLLGSRNVGVAPGGSVTLSVSVGASDKTGLRILWRNAQNTVLGSGESLTLQNVTAKNAYYCDVTDAYGNTAEAVCSVYVENHLTITALCDTILRVPYGGSATLSAAVSADDQTGLRWWWGDEPAAGAAQSGLTRSVDPVTRSRYYSLHASDAYGNEVSLSFRVIVENGFSVENANSTQRITVAPGEGVTLAPVVHAADETELQFRWYGDALAQPATTRTLTLSDPVRNGMYNCSITDRWGNQATVNYNVTVENHLRLKAVGGSYLTLQPGATATLSVSVTADDTSVLEYEWSCAVQNIYGEWTNVPFSETGASAVTLPATRAARYNAIVTDCYGNRYGVNFYVSVGDGLSLTRVGEAERTVAPGGSTELAVTAAPAAAPGLRYQWFEDPLYSSWLQDENLGTTANRGTHGFEIAGATDAALTLSDVRTSKRYTCVATDQYGNVALTEFAVTVPNGLTLQPVGETARSGPAGSITTLSVTAAANDMDGLTYRWYQVRRDETQTATYLTTLGCTGSSCALSMLTGTVGCMAVDRYGNMAQTEFDLSVTDGPRITAHPVDCRGDAGETASFTVAASGESLRYRWQFAADGVSWTDSTAAGCSTDTLRVTVTAAAFGSYRCLVTDGAGLIGTSMTAKLSRRTPTSGVCGDALQWSVDDAGRLTVSGSGDMWDSPEWDLSGVKTVVLSDGVTGIGASAFADCADLEMIILSTNVTGIGANAFSGCTELAFICFNGTDAQWTALPKGAGNDPLLDAELITPAVTTAIRRFAVKDGTAELLLHTPLAASELQVWIAAYDGNGRFCGVAAPTLTAEAESVGLYRVVGTLAQAGVETWKAFVTAAQGSQPLTACAAATG